MKPSKAKDAYGLDTHFLKLHKDMLVCPITHLINLSIKMAVVPSGWKVAIVSPIFKSGDKTNISNYRPISILPVVSKVAEKWIAKLLNKHLNNGHPLLHPMQFGFRQYHSTETANCVFIETVKSLLDKTICVGAVFLDLKKAFDTVDHRTLLSKLTHFNFAENALDWFQSYLSNRRQSVSVGGTNSSYLECSAGVPQGSILGPVLFSVYINDLPNVCQTVHFQMYADDAVIFTPAKSTQEASSSLTSALENIQHWLLESGLLLNKKKTVAMMFTKKPIKLERSNVFLGGMELDIVEEFKYLGVTLDPTLSFKKHIKLTANRIKFNLQNFKQIRSSMTITSAKMFLHSMIFSHIDYCITTWSLAGNTILKPIEMLFKQSIKILDQKPLSYHQCNILGKYNMLNFGNFIHFKNCCLIYKVFHGLAPPSLSTFIKPRSDRGYCTRASFRGDLEIPLRKTTFGQTVLSIRGGHFWNSIPTNIRECPTYCTFKKHFKLFLKSSQLCHHFD